MVRALLVLVLLLGLVGCAAEEPSAAPPEPESGAEAGPDSGPDPELRAELVRLMKQDQGLRTGGEQLNSDQRTARLKEIIAEHGWPTYDLVGKEGEDAAWLIAQHADLDPDFQAEALELLRGAVAEGQASPGNLAYLEDRVRAARGEPQLYGTQTGCTRNGEPADPDIEDPAQLDARREEAGLPPYDRYLRQMTRICGQSQ